MLCGADVLDPRYRCLKVFPFTEGQRRETAIWSNGEAGATVVVKGADMGRAAAVRKSEVELHLPADGPHPARCLGGADPAAWLPAPVSARSHRLARTDHPSGRAPCVPADGDGGTS